MERRLLLAVFLSFLVLFLYQSLVVRPRQRPAAEEEAGQARPSEKPRLKQPPPAQVPSELLAAQEPLTTAVLADTSLREVVVESPRIRAVFWNRGAQLRSWRLKNYHDERGEPVELVPTELPASESRPFALSLEDSPISRRLNGALFRPSAAGLRVGDQGGTLSFEFADASGLFARKEFRFGTAQHPYVVSVTTEVRLGDRVVKPALLWGPGLATGDSETSKLYYRQGSQAVFSVGQKVTRIGAADLAARGPEEGRFDFVGIDDHYFLAAVVRPDQPLSVQYRAVTLPGQAGDAGAARTFVAYGVSPEKPPLAVQVFLGPKDFDVLAAVDRDLVRAINFGWFAWLVVPLLRSLKWVNTYVGNYGWSIIILTVLINAAMFPLRHRSVVSMRKMQGIQPQVKAIQERYAKLKIADPARQKMNAELMSLYREHGVNPAGGCLPMLLTLPVLFAFYSMLAVAIELRGAPFIFWIKDLSRHDPLYVTPLLMGVTMVWQQKMTPTTADPVQQRMMMFMPIVFTVMFLWAPSGLVIYWFVSNLWAIGQQVVTNRIIGAPRIRTVHPPAERRLKKVGGARSEGEKQA